MKKRTISIKGLKWSYLLLTKEQFQERHKENKDDHAICHKDDFYMDFRKDSFTLPTVIHEVTHAFVGSCCIGSADLDDSDMEEILCEINAYHIEDILKVSKKIYKDLGGRKK